MTLKEVLKSTNFENKQDVLEYLVKDQNSVLDHTYSKEEKLKFVCPSCGVIHSKSMDTVLKGKGAYCRNCSKLRNIAEYRQLYGNFPIAAEMFDNGNNIEQYSGRKITSKHVSHGSHIEYEFKCHNGHVFKSPVADVVRSEKSGSKACGCPYCSGTNTSLIPSIAEVIQDADVWWDTEKNGGSAKEVPYQKYSHRKYNWVCPKGHLFTRSLDKIKDNRLSCPVCSGHKFVSGVNDIATLVPQIAKYFDEEKNGIKVSEAFWSKHSERDYWWKCPKGHSFIRKPANIDVNNFTCAVCQGKQVIMGENDLQTLRPDIMEYWCLDNDIKPWNITVDSMEQASFICVMCGDIYDTSISSRTRSRGLCPNCNTAYTISYGEMELSEFLDDIGVEYETQAKVFKNKSKSCDFFIPDHKVVIEYNGLYWHSEAANKGKYYHYNRYKELEELGIQLVNVWEDNWVQNRDMVERMLKRKLGVSKERRVNARECKIYLETSEDINLVKDFLNINHIQGFKSGSLYISLRDVNMEIVALMVLQNNGDGVYNIVRYATSCIVRGGFTKILSVLKDELGVKIIQTFSDNGVSTGSLYKNSGFTLVKELPPDYCYVYKDTRVHKFNLRKSSFKKGNFIYKEGLSESELASLNNIPRLWDAGKKKWEKIL